MIVYSITMFAVGVLFFGIATSIAKGNIRLISSYHRWNVADSEQQEYGRSIAKGLFSMCGTLVLSGMIGLIGESEAVGIASVAVLLVGIAISIAIIIRVQKRYNGGLF